MVVNARASFYRAVACLSLTLATSGSALGQYGPVLSGAGPVNRSMGAVAVANPLSPSAALY